MRSARICFATVVALAASGCASSPRVELAPAAAAGFRVVAPSSGDEASFAEMLDRLARADVVFFGEQHDDPETHRAETIVLEALGRTGRPVVLSLEMFERDVQPVVNDYLAGRITEADFLARSRPWENYAMDYRPLLEMAKARGWPVIAANVPRPLATAVSRVGFAVLDTLSATERAHIPRELLCPKDAYHARFLDAMKGHGSGGPATSSADTLPTAMAERFYLSQCMKDEVMAESIANALRAAPRNAIVVHYNGLFHSDYRQGTVDRVRRRIPDRRLAVVTAVAVPDPAAAPIAPEKGRADFIIFTRERAGPR
jgi:uncharacterized iron-regulated protein